MIRSLYYASGAATCSQVHLEDIAALLQQPTGLLWVDLVGEVPEACRPLLQDTFGFHPLAVDDALDEAHVPKIDDWGTYVYLVLHAVAVDPHAREPLDTSEVDLFLGRHYLVTYRTEPVAAIDRLWDACQRDVRHLEKGTSRLLYRLADELVADYMPAIDAMDEAIDDVEDEVFGQPRRGVLERIFTLKRALLHMRRIIAPQREVLNRLGRGDYAVIDEGERVFFRDVYDHLVRLYDITEGLRDLVGGALETYLSVVSNRLSEVMKTLTIITTMFMPISFLVGFFGMNFFQPTVPLRAWTSLPAFLLTLVVIVLVPVGMFLWMRKRAWM